MNSQRTTEDFGLPARIVGAVSSKAAETRVDLAKHLQVAPSTISLYVQDLLDAGVLSEKGRASSRGGRPAKILAIKASAGHFLVADLGGTHARLGIADLSGKLLATTERPISIADGPESVLDQLTKYFGELEEERQVTSSRKGACVGLPGPVDAGRQRVDSPSRMPGWNQYPAAAELTSRLGTATIIENDANLLALGENCLHEELSSSITVKAGTGIGAGMVIDGALYHGATGVAGDLSHARVPDGSQTLCACGNTGCLEAVASGAALVEEMRQAGRDVENVLEIAQLANDGDVTATSLVRGAGHRLGAMLCPIVGFTNPQAVFLGGLLSTLEPYVASVRSQLYDGCHPLVTKDLIIDRATGGPDVALVGGAHLLAKEALAARGTE